MDLNEIPSDQMLNPVELSEKNLAKSEGKLEDSRQGSEVEGKNFREVDEKCLALELEIGKKNMELDAIRIRVMELEGEKAAIEEELGILKKKNKAALEGVELSLDDWIMESVEESKVDQLMIENKVLECVKMSALKEVEVWKQKSKELESRVVELEGKLSSQGGDGVLNRANSASRSCSQGANARDGEVQMEGSLRIETPANKHLQGEESATERVQGMEPARRQLVYRNWRSCDRKIAPSTPGGAINSIESDDDHDGPDKHVGFSFHSKATRSVTESAHDDKTVDVMDLDDTTNCKDNIFVATPKRKRGAKMVCSDDECEDDEVTPIKRAFKINDTENESDEDDYSMPVRRASKEGNGNRQGGDDEDDDDIPISQRKLKRSQHSSQPIARRTRSRSGRQAVSVTQCRSGRRRLVKSQRGEEISGRKEETVNSPEMMTENVEDSDSAEDDDSDSEADSLKNFIQDDSDVEGVQDDVAEDGTAHFTEAEDSSDSNLGFRDIISRLQRRKSPNSKWALEGEMLSDFGKDHVLCMKAVCALYRQQTADEKLCKESRHQNGRGFSKFDASRGTKLGEFLTDGDPNGSLVKTVDQLRWYDPEGVEACCRLAKHYSKQLFEIYKNNEDPFFP